MKKSDKIQKDDVPYIIKVRSRGEKVLYTFVCIFFSLYALSLLYPIFFLGSGSLQSQGEYIDNLIMGDNPFAIPKSLHFENYKEAMESMYIANSVGRFIYLPEMFFNSFWYCIVSVAAGLIANSCTAYVLSKYKFKGKDAIYSLFILIMTLPITGTAGAAFKLISELGLYNNPLKAVIENLGGYGFNFLVLYAAFKSVSWSYAEAVFIDGGGHFTAFFKIMLPQVSGALITLGILGFIGHWNIDTPILLYLPDYPTVAAGLYKVKRSMGRSGNVPAYYAGLMVTVFPVVALYAIYAGKITKNMSVGGLKG